MKYFNTSFSVTTVYPVAELNLNPVETVISEDDTTEAPTEDNALTQSFFPTLGVIETALEASTLKPETRTFVPFIPNILPEVTSAFTVENPLSAAVEEESTNDAVEEAVTQGAKVETLTEQVEKAETEVEEIPSAEHEEGGEGESEEEVTKGKASSG